jgi:serine protease Do
VANQLRASGKVTRGRIGVVIQEVTKELADYFGLNSSAGALISSVEKGGSADKAGIQASDVILKFDGKVIHESRDLPRNVAATQPGSKVTVQLWRKGTTKEVKLIVDELPSEGRITHSSKSELSAEQIARLGLSVVELSKEQKKQLDIENGLLIEDLKGTSARNDLQRGDIILALGNTPIVSIEQLNSVLKSIPKARNVALLIRRGDTSSYIAIKLDEK